MKGRACVTRARTRTGDAHGGNFASRREKLAPRRENKLSARSRRRASLFVARAPTPFVRGVRQWGGDGLIDASGVSSRRPLVGAVRPNKKRENDRGPRRFTPLASTSSHFSLFLIFPSLGTRKLEFVSLYLRRRSDDVTEHSQLKVAQFHVGFLEKY